MSRLAPGYEAIQAAILLIMSKFSEELALEDVLAVSHMSKANFSRRFLAYTGKTFTEFLNDVRIDYACQKLLGTDESIGEIAFTSGYHNLSHFTACFAAIAAPHRPTTARPVLNRSDRPTGTCSPRTGQIKLQQPPMATSVSVSPDGRMIATGHTGGSIRLTDLTTGKSESAQTQQSLAPVKHNITTWSVAFSPAGHWLASAGADTAIRLQNVSTGDDIGPFGGHDDHHVTSVAFSGDGRLVASAGNDETICVRSWETPDVMTSTITDIGMNHMSSLTFNPRGTLIGVADREGRIAVWDVKSKQKVDSQSGYSIAFSPDGRFYVIGSKDGTVRLRDAKTRKHVRYVVEHPQSVRAVAFSADGRTLASASSDGLIRLATIEGTSVQWDPREIQFSPHVGNIRQLVFSPDARHLVTANQNGTVFVLRLETR